MAFRNILLSAIVVGVLTGLAYGLFQQSQISPIIYAAEVYEVAEEPATSQDHHGAESVAHHHDAEAEAWGPADGFERIAYTYSADIAVGIAFALIMISLMALHNLKSNKPKVTALVGGIWGVAAMLSLFVAPALFGLHPEVPGTEAAVLENRQLWWVFCAAASIAGIAIVYYAPMMFKLGGVLVGAVPHLIGAPMPEHHGFANTDPSAVKALSDLATQFYTMTGAGMLVFFVLLGVLSGLAVNRYIRL
jgi:cobalt transporter subunit CbtA